MRQHSRRGLLSQNIYSKRELDNSSKSNQTRAKGSLPEKNTTSKKELLTLALGKVAEGS
jgi:hypothetical protein